MYNFDVLLERRHTDSTKWDAMDATTAGMI